MKHHQFAKIVATLGPATNDQKKIEKLFKSGATIFRLNFSHGTHKEHKARHDAIRAVEKSSGCPVSIIADLQGPKLRIGQLAQDFTTLKVGQKFILDHDQTPGDNTRVYLPHPELFKALKKGGVLYIFDGKIRLKINKVSTHKIETTVTHGGKLTSNKGVNVPDITLPLSALTKKDRIDLKYALKLNVDWVALSFVQKPADVKEARKIIGDKARIIVKIEKPSAVENFDNILALTDAVMIARGDLGVEMPVATVPATQKHIIRQCRAAGKPVIVATQMLDSMVSAPSPTRAEVSDVATAVYDGADAVMLSEETAAGQYPVASVTMMRNVIKNVESDVLYRPTLLAYKPAVLDSESDAISAAARGAAKDLDAACIVTYTTSGSTAVRASRQRPQVPIVGISGDIRTARHLALAWGVYPVHTKDARTFEEMVDIACRVVHQEKFGKKGDEVVITAGTPFGTPGATNVLRIAKIEQRHTKKRAT